MPLLRVRCELVGVFYAVATCTLCVGRCTLCRCCRYFMRCQMYPLSLLHVLCALLPVLCVFVACSNGKKSPIIFVAASLCNVTTSY